MMPPRIADSNKGTYGRLLCVCGSVGMAGAADSSYLIFDATNAQIDKNGAYVEIHDVVKFSGWLAVNGGVDRYVYQINGGEWKTVGGNPGSPTSGGVYNAIVGNANIYDKENSHVKAHYQNAALKIEGLQAYANETIDLVFGAVPANNPGAEADPNVIILTVIQNLKVSCMHGKDFDLTATADPTIFAKVCKVCDTDLGQVSGINHEGLKLYDGAEIAYVSTQNSNNYTGKSTTTVTDENGLTYAHIVCTTEVASGKESYFYMNVSGWASSPTNVDKVVAILYRAEGVTGDEIFIDKGTALGGGNQKSPSWTKNGSWQLATFDFTSKTNWSKETGVGHIRWDIFNGATAVGSYIDVAYFGFFSSVDEATEYYATFADTYGLRWRGNLDGGSHVAVDGTAVASGSLPGHNVAVKVDFAGKTLTAANSVTVGGWNVVPGGTASYQFRVVTVDGEAVENPAFIEASAFKGGNTAANHAITKVGIGLGYPTDCGVGAAFQKKCAVDLSGFEGKTVTVEFVAVTNNGNNIVIAILTNIAVPATPATE